MSTLFRKVIVNSASNIAVPLASFISAPILAHGLGVVGRGEVAAATAPLFLLVVAGSLGLPEAVTFFAARAPITFTSHVLTALILTVGSGAVCTVGIVLVSNSLSGGGNELRAIMILAAIALLPNLLVGVFRGAAIGLQKFRLVFWERIVASAVRLLVLVALWLSGNLTPFMAVVAIAYLPLIGAFVYICLLSERRDRFEPFSSELVRYGLRTWVGSLSGILLSRIDQVLMVPLASTSELGLYAVAVSISEVPLVLNASLREVLFAVDSAEPNRDRMAQVGRLSSFITGVICLLFAGFCPFVIPKLFGDQFHDSVGVCLVLLFAVAIGNPGSIAGTALTSVGRPGLRSIALVVACTVNVLLVLLLVPSMGATGAAWATAAANIISSCLVVAFCSRFAGYRWFDFYGLRRRDLLVICVLLKRR